MCLCLGGVSGNGERMMADGKTQRKRRVTQKDKIVGGRYIKWQTADNGGENENHLISVWVLSVIPEFFLM